jgi:galactose mutarotase-like enzyme
MLRSFSDASPRDERSVTGGWLRYAGACRWYETTILGHRSLLLESPFLRTHVLVDRGGAFFDLLDKRSDFELLWRWRRGVRPAHYTPSVDLPQGGYQDHFFGGWDFMFPAVDRSQPAAPLPTGYHGETFMLPWRWSVEVDEPNEVVVSLHTRCVRSPFLVSRRLSLTAERPELVVETRARNVGLAPAQLSCGEHIAFRVDEYIAAGGTLELEGSTGLETMDEQASPSSRLATAARSEWPSFPGADGDVLDLRRLDAGWEGCSDVLGATWGSSAAVRVGADTPTLPTFTLAWDAERVPASVFWLALGGDRQAPWYGEARLLAIEPMSMLPWREELHVLQPNEELTYAVRLSIEPTEP